MRQVESSAPPHKLKLAKELTQGSNESNQDERVSDDSETFKLAVALNDNSKTRDRKLYNTIKQSYSDLPTEPVLSRLITKQSRLGDPSLEYIQHRSRSVVEMVPVSRYSSLPSLDKRPIAENAANGHPHYVPIPVFERAKNPRRRVEQANNSSAEANSPYQNIISKMGNISYRHR